MSLTESSEFLNISNSKIDYTKCLEGSKDENSDKNRYINVLPVDRTRVKISEGKYINANYVQIDKNRSLIASQAPTEETEEDFWKMAFEHKSPLILMLTRFIEKGNVKCSRYLPSSHKMFVYKDVKVTNLGDVVGGEAPYETTKIEIEKGREKHILKHYHYTKWPDHGVPKKDDILDLLLDLSHTLSLVEVSFLPIIHCSAGIGRTGTIIAILRCLQTGEKPREALTNIRRDRHGLVQTKEQYRFILDFLK